jgi:hypothetical protein
VWAETDLEVADDRLLLLDLAARGRRIAPFEDGHRGRQLAVDDEVLAVGRGVAAMRAVGDGYVARDIQR